MCWFSTILSEMEDKLIQTFKESWDHLLEKAPNLLFALLVLIVFVFIGKMLDRLLRKRLFAKWEETIVKNFTLNLIKWFFYLVGLFAALDFLELRAVVNSLITGAGITAIILGFAFKDIGENFLAGFLLAVNRPFKLGNIIEVNQQKGVVKEMDMRTTHIRNIEGKDIYIPNAMIVKNIVINYTRDGLLRQEFDICLDIQTNLEEAKNLILNFLKRQPEILPVPQANVLVTDVSSSAITIKILFWVDILKGKKDSPSYLGLTIRSRMMDAVKDLLLNNGFKMPSTVFEHKSYKKPLEITIVNEG